MPIQAFRPERFCGYGMLTRLSTFASKTPAVAGVLLVGLHYTAFRDAIREDSRQTTPSRGVTQRKKFAVEANVESRVKGRKEKRRFLMESTVRESIERNPNVSPAQIADMLGVSPRTVYRILAKLRH